MRSSPPPPHNLHTQMYTLRRGTTSCGIHSMSFNAAATRLAVSSSNRTIHIFDVSSGGAAGGDRGRAGRRLGNADSPRQGSGGGNDGGGQGQEGNPENGVNADKSAARRRGSGDGTDSGSSGSSSSLASGFRSVVGMLPNRVTKRMQDYVDCERSFASVRLRGSAGRSICALIPAGDRAGGPGPAGVGGAGGGNESRQDAQNTQGELEAEEEGEILLVVTNEGILYSYIVDTVNGGECRLDEASSLLMDPNASQELGSELFVPERQAPSVGAEQQSKPGN